MKSSLKTNLKDVHGIIPRKSNDFMKTNITQNMPEYGFSLTRLFSYIPVSPNWLFCPYTGTRESRKHVFWHTLRRKNTLMLSNGLLPIFRQKDIERDTNLKVPIQIVDLRVSYGHLCFFRVSKVPLFNLCILTLIMVKLFGLVQEKNPTRKQAHHLYEFLWS